jgi:hypothetical protein
MMNHLPNTRLKPKELTEDRLSFKNIAESAPTRIKDETLEICKPQVDFATCAQEEG